MDGRRERSDALSHQLDVRQLLNDLRYAQHKRDHEDADGCSADEAAHPRPVALEAGSPPLGGRRFRDKLPLAPVRCDEVASLESVAAVDDLESPARDLEDGRQFRLRHVAPVSVEPCDDLAVRVTQSCTSTDHRCWSPSFSRSRRWKRALENGCHHR